METQKRCHILPRWWCVSCTLQAAVWRTIEQLTSYSLLRGISTQITVFAYNLTSYFDFFQATKQSVFMYFVWTSRHNKQHYLIGFYHPDGECLLSGSN